ncbi:hypothetical protein QUW41_07145 [Slackia piriformis]|nr:hypothetical protein [Slackia piriformis]
MEVIKLISPLKVNGKELSELMCDMDAVDAEGFIRAEALSNAKRNNEGSVASMAEVDYGFHLYLAFEGVKAAMPEVDTTDLERVKGRDLVQLMQVGRFFTLVADGGSEGSSSDAPSESSQESSTAAPMK